MPIESWVTLQEVVQHLRVTEDSIYHWITKIHCWITRKGMPAAKAGLVWRFKLSEVDHWLKVGGTTPSKETVDAAT